jgi:hypothetical protein
LEDQGRNIIIVVILAFVVFLLSLGFVSVDKSILANLVSALVPGIYLILFFRFEEHGMEKSPTVLPENLWREHRILDQSVSRRENSILITGSIFVTASLVLIGQSVSVALVQPNVAVFTSWLMYSIWLFFLQFPAGRLTDWTFRRLKGIETELGIEGHLYIVRRRDPFRRYVWLWVLNGLLVAGYAVLGIDLLYLRVIIPIQVGIVVLHYLIQRRLTV